MNIAIIGAGGHGRVVLDIIRASNLHRAACFIDLNEELAGTIIDGVSVWGNVWMLDYLNAEQVRSLGVNARIVAIGDNVVRRDQNSYLELHNHLAIINVIHPSSNIAVTVSIGFGVVVAPGVNICAHARIGDGVILNTGCIVEHECVIGDYAHICPGAALAGRVTVGQGAFVGINASVKQGVKIGEWAVVGAGAVVLHDVPAHTTVAGVPARRIK